MWARQQSYHSVLSSPILPVKAAQLPRTTCRGSRGFITLEAGLEIKASQSKEARYLPMPRGDRGSSHHGLRHDCRIESMWKLRFLLIQREESKWNIFVVSSLLPLQLVIANYVRGYRFGVSLFSWGTVSVELQGGWTWSYSSYWWYCIIDRVHGKRSIKSEGTHHMTFVPGSTIRARLCFVSDFVSALCIVIYHKSFFFSKS